MLNISAQESINNNKKSTSARFKFLKHLPFPRWKVDDIDEDS